MRGFLTGAAERRQNISKNAIYVIEYVDVPVTQHDVAHRFKLRRPLRVLGSLAGVRVLSTIYLDDNTLLRANEIDDEPSNRDLPLELQPVEAPVAQLQPQLLLGIG